MRRSAPIKALSETATGALVCQGSEAHLGCRPFRPRGNAAFDGQLSRIEPAVCSSGYRHQCRNRPHRAGRAAGSIAATPAPFQNQPHSSKVFAMPPTEVAARKLSQASGTDFRPLLVSRGASAGNGVSIRLCGEVRPATARLIRRPVQEPGSCTTPDIIKAIDSRRVESPRGRNFVHGSDCYCVSVGCV